MKKNFYKLFKTKKPIIAMVHFPALPGSPLYDEKKGLKYILNSIQADVKHLQNDGVDAIMFGNDGIKVSALCPQLVNTDMLKSSGDLPEDHPLLKDGVLSADFVANETIKGINAEKFLILPHKQVEKYIQGKAFDYDSWIEAVRELAP